jgi:hypothetical protein
MALEASHIRLALDIQDLLGVENIDAYVSGSIYPDSRYVTGIDRIATHPEDYRNDLVFQASDFNKGWYAHLLADEMQQAAMKEILPVTQTGTGLESWIKRSAIKILQDIDDASKFDLAKYLQCLKHIENPNGEDIAKMKEYQDIFPWMYADLMKYNEDIALQMWLKFGVGEENVEKMRITVETYSKDGDIMQGVRGLYGVMLARVRQELRA